MATEIEDSLEDQLFEEFKQELIEEGIYAEGQVEDEAELEGLWKSLASKQPELSGRLGILLITKEGLQGVSGADILEVIESVTKGG